ncbi:uncharacterized protein LOC113281536 isoform X2 [Papaver somniferum]|uniref:uncharacterized protein LOC113281536 isoform X2 n=1 Tax=Papaver somniferum TaxID=3469 RepID=UPI000E705979|nr:uncharacterized protein LOC113281536 isoform X2 [Papaver somniferum]XP_026386100.1 uncharacterized protein LOC113281536 isoform X2 [Papaver somniferum]
MTRGETFSYSSNVSCLRPYPGRILCTILILQAPRQWVLVKMGDHSYMLAEIDGDWNLVDRHDGDVHQVLLQGIQMIQQGVKQHILSSLHLSSFSWYFPCCPIQMNAPLHPASKFLVFHYRSLMLLLSLINSELSILGRGLFVHYQLPSPNVYSGFLLPMGMLIETLILVVVIQILKMLAWVGYLRWKFRLYPPMLCYAINWNSKTHWFCEAEVNNQIAAALRKSNLFLISFWSSWTTCGTIWPFTDLPGTSTSFGYGRLLFDRGTKLGSILMAFTAIGDAKLNYVIAGIYTQVRILHGFTPRQFLTEVSAVTFVIMFIYEDSLQLTSKNSVHCQDLEGWTNGEAAASSHTHQ